jgi:hypothetical protein
MLEIKDGRFVTQIIYRCHEEKQEFVLGYVATFEGQGEAKRYKKSDPGYMYKDFWHSFKASVDGVDWTDGWVNQTQAIGKLLKHHGKDEVWGSNHIIPCSQTFIKQWRDPDHINPDHIVEYKPKKWKK